MFRTILSVCVVLTLATPAFAQEESSRTDDEVRMLTTDLQMRPRQQQRLLGQLFMFPVYFMGWITVHEGSHALVGLAVGREIVGFEPYPHRITVTRDDEDREEFVWGCIWSVGPENEDPWRQALFSIAPAITDLLIFTAADLTLQYGVNPHSTGAPFLLGGGMVTPLVDFIAGLNCMHDDCDWSKFSEHGGIPRGALMMLGYGLAFTAIWRCLHHFRRIFMEPRSAAERRDRQRTISIAPITGREMSGLGLNGRF